MKSAIQTVLTLTCLLTFSAHAEDYKVQSVNQKSVAKIFFAIRTIDNVPQYVVYGTENGDVQAYDSRYDFLDGLRAPSPYSFGDLCGQPSANQKLPNLEFSECPPDYPMDVDFVDPFTGYFYRIIAPTKEQLANLPNFTRALLAQ